MKTILIQGAMNGEIEYLVNHFNCIQKQINEYTFYETSYKDINIVISLTKIGIINATIATMLGIYTFKPDIIINQGTAGGHTPNMKVGDIVIGKSCVYLNNPRTPIKGVGEGSNALEWRPGKAGTFILEADQKLINIAEETPYDGNKVIGRLGSGDIYSREADRIALLHSELNELCEDMETIAVYKACHTMNTPVLGIRIISNNELLGNYDEEEQFTFAQKKLQKFILDYIEKLHFYI